MITIEQIVYVIPVLALTVSILYYALNLRTSNKTQQMQLETRQAQLAMDIYTRWSSPEFKKYHQELMYHMEWDSPEEFIEKYRNADKQEQWMAYSVCCSFFEGIGVLVKRGFIDKYLVDDLISGEIISIWEKMSPTILYLREKANYPTLYEYFEYLYNEILPIFKKEHPEHIGKILPDTT